MTDLLGMPEEKFAVLLGKRGEAREFASVPLTRDQLLQFQSFISKHLDELVEHMAEVGVDARTIIMPDLHRFATADDIRLYGSLEQRRSLIARLMADIRDEERVKAEADEFREAAESVSIRDFANNVVIEHERPSVSVDNIHVENPLGLTVDDVARILNNPTGGNG